MGIVALVADPRPAGARRGVSRARRRRRRLDLGDSRLAAASSRCRLACADGWAGRCSSSRGRPSRRPPKRAPSSRSCLATASTSPRRRALKRSSSASIRRIGRLPPGCAGRRSRGATRSPSRSPKSNTSSRLEPTGRATCPCRADSVRSSTPPTFADLRPKPEPIARPPHRSRRRPAPSAHLSFDYESVRPASRVRRRRARGVFLRRPRPIRPLSRKAHARGRGPSPCSAAVIWRSEASPRLPQSRDDRRPARWS